MKEVAKQEYLNHFIKRDAVLKINGNTSEWRLRGRDQIIAKNVNNKYYINEDE